MHKSSIMVGLLILLMPLLMFADWTSGYITISVPDMDSFSDGASRFGVNSAATDTFDLGIDRQHPPCPMSNPCVYFAVSGFLVDKLIEDYRADVAEGDSIIWNLTVSGTGAYSYDVSWDISEFPTSGDFYAVTRYPGVTTWDGAINMRTVSSLHAMPSQLFAVKYIKTTTVTDEIAPSVTNMDPVNGATDVDIMSTINLDIVDNEGGSGVDLSSVHLVIAGMDVTAYATSSEIENGYRFTYTPPMPLPECTAVSVLISACDNEGNCLTDYIYAFNTACDVDYIISGTVTDLASLAPIAGASVTTSGAEIHATTTSSTGEYTITCASAGSYQVTAAATGYITSDPVSVDLSEADPTEEVNFALRALPTTGRLYGTVSNESHEAIPGAVVEITGHGSSTTTSTGAYSFLSLPLATRLYINVSADGYVTVHDSITLSADSTVKNFVLAEEIILHRVYGTIQLEGTTDFSLINVQLENLSTSTTYPEMTSSDGSYDFDSTIPEGEYRFTASKGDYVTYTIDTLIEGDTQINATLEDTSTTEDYIPARNITASDGNYLYWVAINWDEPMESGYTELGYDDGVAENLPGGYTHIGAGYGSESGVVFTPPSAGCTLLSVRLNVLTDDGEGTAEIHFRDVNVDEPGDDLFSPMFLPIEEDGDWNTLEIPGGYPLTSDDDFFVGMRDVIDGSDTINFYIGCDKSDCDFRSWIGFDEGGSTTWNNVEDFTYEGLNVSDFMIRALLRLPDGSLLEVGPTLRTTNTHNSGVSSIANLTKRSVNKSNINQAIVRTASHDVASTPVHTVRKPFASTEALELTGYNVYRCAHSFTSTSDPDVELIGTTTADTLFYADFLGDDDSLIYLPDDSIYYGVTAVYDGIYESDVIIDPGYYVDLKPAGDILIVDLIGSVEMAEFGGEAITEPQFFEYAMNEINVADSFDIVVTEPGEGLVRYDLSDVKALFIIGGMTDEVRIDLTDPELEQLYNYIDSIGGYVYYEGCISAFRYAEDDQFATHFGFDADSCVNSDSIGNVDSVYTMDSEFFEGSMSFSYPLTYLPDWHNAQLHARTGAHAIWKSQEDSRDIPVDCSPIRGVYKNHYTSDAKTVFSSVYLGSFGEGDYPSVRTRVLGSILNYFGIYNTDVTEENPNTPSELNISSVYPNPFNSAVEITFNIEKPSMVTLSIYDVTGKEIANIISDNLEVGSHNATWNGTDKNGNTVSSGVYFAKLNSGSKTTTTSLMYVK